MIVQEEFLNSLRRHFNLNLYEVKIWVALVSRGISTAGELSDIGDVPRSRAYDVLESLEKKGFVTMKIGKPIKYLAVEPTEVVERTKKLIQKDAKESITKLDKMKGTQLIKELETLYDQGVEFVNPADMSGSIRGRENIHMHMNALLKNAKRSATIVTTAKGLINKIGQLRETFEKLNKKGVKIKIAVPVNKESANAIEEAMKFAEVKNLNKINARFCLVDNKDIMFMLLDDKEVHPTYDLGVWTNTPFFTKAIEDMFELTWKNLEPAKRVLGRI